MTAGRRHPLEGCLLECLAWGAAGRMITREDMAGGLRLWGVLSWGQDVPTKIIKASVSALVLCDLAPKTWSVAVVDRSARS